MAVEYAKFVKVQANNASRGFQTVLTLPSAKTLNTGYINFYLGLGPFEAGISFTPINPGYKDPVTGLYKWGWFVNGGQANAHPANLALFSDGSQVSLKLTINDSTNYVEFYVNSQKVWDSSQLPDTATKKFPGNQNNARLLIAAGTGVDYPTPIPTSQNMPVWPIFHNQVEAKQMMYKDANNNWIAITGNNASITNWRTPSNADGLSDAKNPDPDFYGLSNNLSSSTIYASLK